MSVCKIAEVATTTMTSLWVCVCVSWCLSASLFVRPVSVSLCARVSVPVCVCVYVSSSLCTCVIVCVCACVCACMCLPLCVLFVCVCACGVCLCTVCVCASVSVSLFVRLCVCMCFFAVCLCRSLKFCTYLCLLSLLLLKIWHSISISFLLIIYIIFNEAFTYNVFGTTYNRVTCSSTLSGHPSSSLGLDLQFLSFFLVFEALGWWWLISLLPWDLGPFGLAEATRVAKVERTLVLRRLRFLDCRILQNIAYEHNMLHMFYAWFACVMC